MGKIVLSCLSLLLLFVSFHEPIQPPILTPSGMSLSRDGRLVISWQGDLWMAKLDPTSKTLISGTWTPLTQSRAEERDPVWHPDGERLFYATDTTGAFDIWEMVIPEEGPKGTTQAIISSAEPDLQPSFAQDGTMVWTRGLGARSDIWMRKSDGQTTQVTSTLGPDHSPALHPDGNQLLYINERKKEQRLQIMELANKKKRRTIQTGKRPLFPQWSPDGELITFSTRNQPMGLWVTDAQGSYTNLLSTSRAIAVWSKEAKHLLLQDITRNPPAYNGDPIIGPSRPTVQPLAEQLQLSVLPAPAPLGQQQKQSIALPSEGPDQYLNYFDKTVDFLSERYQLNIGKTATKWKKLVTQCRSDIAKANNEEQAMQIMYRLIEDRPTLKEEAKGKAGISSAHPLATAAGLEILEAGGNVVDAAIAVSFALGVVEPDASGVGGYGEMLVYLKGMAAPTCIEFLTRVPEAASLSNGQLQSIPNTGPVLVNVPGTVAGMELAWQRYGSKKVAWKDLLEPAIRLAKEGYAIDASFATTLSMEREAYERCNRCQSLFFRNGQTLQAGDTLRNPDLAYTLGMIAYRGKDGFYKGRVAQRMVEDLRSKGNVMTLNDLSRYYAVERPVVQTTYRDHTIYAGAPPVSGGALLTAKLNLLDAYKKPEAYTQDAATAHAMIEAWKLSPSTSGRIADPGLWPVNLTPFTDKATAESRWASCFNPIQSVTPLDSTCLDTRVAASWGAEGVLEAKSSTGTTAFAVADGDGNMVSVTQTLGTWGGNFYVTPGLGFIYNDKLRSYSSNPKRYNARIPFARNVTSISPTMIFKGTADKQEPFVALGAAGNAWITSAVYQMTTGIIDQGLGPQAALELPRFLVGVQRDSKDRSKVTDIVVQVENGFAPGVLQQLNLLGHELQAISTYGELRMGYGAAVMVEKGQVRAGADPRRSGEAGVVK